MSGQGGADINRGELSTLVTHTISFCKSGAGDSIESLPHRVDEALHGAKAAGRNRVEVS